MKAPAYYPAYGGPRWPLGVVFTLSGEFEKTQKRVVDQITTAGGHVTIDIRHSNYLVLGNKPSKRDIHGAAKSGIPIISQYELISALSLGAAPKILSAEAVANLAGGMIYDALWMDKPGYGEF